MKDLFIHEENDIYYIIDAITNKVEAIVETRSEAIRFMNNLM